MDEKMIYGPMMEVIGGRDFSVIGIDGLGGAGKSTVSERVCGELERRGFGVVLLHLDDFIHPRAVRYDPALPEWQCYYEKQWRYGHFLEVIRGLRADGAARAELYDKDNDCYRVEQLRAEGRTAVVAEGIFLQRRELWGVFDFTVYIDVPEEARLERVLKRDTYIGGAQEIRDKYERRYFPAERRYLEEYGPGARADVAVRG